MGEMLKVTKTMQHPQDSGHSMWYHDEREMGSDVVVHEYPDRITGLMRCRACHKPFKLTDEQVTSMRTAHADGDIVVHCPDPACQAHHEL